MRRVHSQFVGPVFRLVVVALLLGCMAPAAASAVPKALLSSFGAPNGVLGGQLFFPRGVAVNQSGAGGVPVGSVYVAEGNTNHRISQYTASGGFVRAWGFDVVSGNAETGFEVCAVAAQCKAGVSGVGAGQLNGPQGIAIDQATGYLYVTSSSNRRVDVFSATGQFAGAFGWGVDTGAAALEFCTPAPDRTCQAAAAAGAAGGNLQSLNASIPSIDPNVAGSLYVPDVGNARVSRYSTTIAGGVLTGVSFVKAFGWDVVSSGPGDDTTAPVNELENCVPANGDVCKAGLGTPGGGSGQFGPVNTGSPTSSAVDSTGAVYVASGAMVSGNCTATNPCRIQKFAPNTGSATNFGPTTGPGQIYFETGASTAVAALSIAVDPSNDHVYILRRESNTSYKVLEFDSTGTYIDTHPGGAALTGATNNLGAGLAVGTEGRVYANLSGGSGTNQVNILGPIDPPEVTIEPVTGVGATTATFNASVEIPVPGAPTVTTVYRFEYSKDGSNWSALDNAPVGDGSAGTHTVSRVVGGLEPNTLYLVRAIASTGTGDVISSPTGFMTGASAPRIELAYAEEVTQTEARLGAHIDPEGTPTSYHFEWGTEPCSDVPNPCTELPATPRALGGGNSLVIATEDIDGLDPESGYHYRVVAKSFCHPIDAADTTPSSVPCVTEGPDRQFETLNDCGLTDHRCYEMVSPPDKGPVGSAGDIVALGEARQVQVSPDGSALQYVIAYGTADVTSSSEVPYLARRGPGGWASTQLFPPTLRPPSTAHGSGNLVAIQHAGTADLSCGVFGSSQKLTDDAPDAVLDAGGAVLYRQDFAGGWTAITNLVPDQLGGLTLGVMGGDFFVTGVSQPPAYDGCRRVVFWDRHTYPGVPAAESVWQLYLWEDGVLTNIGVVPGPGGPTVVPSVPGGAPHVAAIATSGTDNIKPANAWNAVSDDASRTYFTANSLTGDDVGRRAVFLYTIGDSAAVDVSGWQTEIANNDDSIYQLASTDGSTMLFTARTGLASNDPELGPTACSHPTSSNVADPINGRGCDLYEYSVGADGEPGTGDDTLVDLSVPEAGTSNSAEGAGVLGVLAASDDAKSVYFAARGQLVAGKGKTAAQNVAEQTFNVYLARDGALTYVSGLSSGLSAPNRTALVTFSTDHVDHWSTRVTPDGDHLLLQSTGNLTGYDSHGEPELYLFDATSDQLACVSCRRDLKPPVADPTLLGQLIAGGRVANRDTPPRQISDDGSRIMFYSRDRLASGASEGKRNLYQWEDGQISLVASSAPTATPTWYVPRLAGMSTSGDDLFVVTVDQLSWRDTDGKLDVYDARVGGGDGPEPEGPPQPCDPLVASDCQSGGGGESVGSVIESGAERGSGPQPSRAVFSVAKLSAAQRAAIVSGRRARLAVKVNQPGVVRVRGLARIGRSKVAVVSGRRRTSSAGKVEVPIRLSFYARRVLARNGKLQVSLTTSFSRSSRAVASRLSLKAKPKPSRRAGSGRGGRR